MEGHEGCLPVATNRRDKHLWWDDADTSSGPIVLEDKEHLSSESVRDRGYGGFGEKIIEVPNVDVVSVKLGRHTLDVVYEGLDGRCGHRAPPFICNVTAFKNDHDAPGVVVSNLE